LQVTNNVAVRFENVLTLIVRYLGIESSLGIDGGGGNDPGSIGDCLVLLTVSRRDVHDARTVVRGYVVGAQRTVRVDAATEIRERRFVRPPVQLGALVAGQNLRLVTEFPRVGSHS